MINSTITESILLSFRKILQCGVCLEMLNEPLGFKCRHYFCKKCVATFLNGKGSGYCPLCRKRILKREARIREDLAKVSTSIREIITNLNEKGKINIILTQANQLCPKLCKIQGANISKKDPERLLETKRKISEPKSHTNRSKVPKGSSYKCTNSVPNPNLEVSSPHKSSPKDDPNPIMTESLPLLDITNVMTSPASDNAPCLHTELPDHVISAENDGGNNENPERSPDSRGNVAMNSLTFEPLAKIIPQSSAPVLATCDTSPTLAKEHQCPSSLGDRHKRGKGSRKSRKNGKGKKRGGRKIRKLFIRSKNRSHNDPALNIVDGKTSKYISTAATTPNVSSTLDRVGMTPDKKLLPLDPFLFTHQMFGQFRCNLNNRAIDVTSDPSNGDVSSNHTEPNGGDRCENGKVYDFVTSSQNFNYGDAYPKAYHDRIGTVLKKVGRTKGKKNARKRLRRSGVKSSQPSRPVTGGPMTSKVASCQVVLTDISVPRGKKLRGKGGCSSIDFNSYTAPGMGVTFEDHVTVSTNTLYDCDADHVTSGAETTAPTDQIVTSGTNPIATINTRETVDKTQRVGAQMVAQDITLFRYGHVIQDRDRDSAPSKGPRYRDDTHVQDNGRSSFRHQDEDDYSCNNGRFTFHPPVITKWSRVHLRRRTRKDTIGAKLDEVIRVMTDHISRCNERDRYLDLRNDKHFQPDPVDSGSTINNIADVVTLDELLDSATSTGKDDESDGVGEMSFVMDEDAMVTVEDDSRGAITSKHAFNHKYNNTLPSVVNESPPTDNNSRDDTLPVLGLVPQTSILYRALISPLEDRRVSHVMDASDHPLHASQKLPFGPPDFEDSSRLTPLQEMNCEANVLFPMTNTPLPPSPTLEPSHSSPSQPTVIPCSLEEKSTSENVNATDTQQSSQIISVSYPKENRNDGEIPGSDPDELAIDFPGGVSANEDCVPESQPPQHLALEECNLTQPTFSLGLNFDESEKMTLGEVENSQGPFEDVTHVDVADGEETSVLGHHVTTSCSQYSVPGSESNFPQFSSGTSDLRVIEVREGNSGDTNPSDAPDHHLNNLSIKCEPPWHSDEPTISPEPPEEFLGLLKLSSPHRSSGFRHSAHLTEAMVEYPSHGSPDPDTASELSLPDDDHSATGANIMGEGSTQGERLLDKTISFTPDDLIEGVTVHNTMAKLAPSPSTPPKKKAIGDEGATTWSNVLDTQDLENYTLNSEYLELSPDMTSLNTKCLNRDMALITTGLDMGEKHIAGQFVGKFHLRLMTNYSSQVSHVVVKTDPSLKCERTLKYFQGILGKKWVISYEWIKACLASNKILPEEPFEVKGDTVTESVTLAPKMSRCRPNSKLLINFEVCCFGNFTPDLPLADLKSLVTLSGAKLIQSPALFDPRGRDRSVILAQPEANSHHDSRRYSDFYKKYGAIPVSREWLFDCIALYDVVPLVHYLFCKTDVMNQVDVDFVSKHGKNE